MTISYDDYLDNLGRSTDRERPNRQPQQENRSMATAAISKINPAKFQTVMFDVSDLSRDEVDDLTFAMMKVAAERDVAAMAPPAGRATRIEVFSETMMKGHEHLGQKVSEWLRAHPDFEMTELRSMQSSDNQFHCVTLILIGCEPL